MSSAGRAVQVLARVCGGGSTWAREAHQPFRRHTAELCGYQNPDLAVESCTQEALSPHAGQGSVEQVHPSISALRRPHGAELGASWQPRQAHGPFLTLPPTWPVQRPHGHITHPTWQAVLRPKHLLPLPHSPSVAARPTPALVLWCCPPPSHSLFLHFSMTGEMGHFSQGLF